MFTLLDPSLHVSHIFFSHRSIASTILTSCASSVPYGNERPYMSLSDLGLGPDREDSSWNRTMRSKPSVGIPVKIIKTFMCWGLFTFSPRVWKHNHIYGIHDPGEFLNQLQRCTASCRWNSLELLNHRGTVDGSELRLTRWYVSYPIISRVLYIPSGDLRISEPLPGHQCQGACH